MANHTSPIDVIILASDGYYAMVRMGNPMHVCVCLCVSGEEQAAVSTLKCLSLPIVAIVPSETLLPWQVLPIFMVQWDRCPDHWGKAVVCLPNAWGSFRL